MPEMQSSAPAAPLPIADGYGEDLHDFALGCECAEPALQIERWQQEAAAPQAPAH